ncbi:hypothetical protein IAP91_16655 [Leuconostoc mesenteroides]|nr:hypothetical protein [Leuconostoc mesenteroides]
MSKKYIITGTLVLVIAIIAAFSFFKSQDSLENRISDHQYVMTLDEDTYFMYFNKNNQYYQASTEQDLEKIVSDKSNETWNLNDSTITVKYDKILHFKLTGITKEGKNLKAFYVASDGEKGSVTLRKLK